MKLDNFETQLKRSSIIFDKYFKETVLKILKGEFEIVEGVTKSRMAQNLDQLSGIDLWFLDPNQGIRGVANRIQFQEKNWRTFTVRKSRESGAKTEYEKRKHAIENNWLYPDITLQGYINKKNEVLGFAIAKTKDIIYMIDNGFCRENKTGKEQIGQAEFYIVDWDKMKKQGFPITIYPS